VTSTIWQIDNGPDRLRATRLSDGQTVQADTEADLLAGVQAVEDKDETVRESERCALESQRVEEARVSDGTSLNGDRGPHPTWN
jgi:hypothetical protein